MTHRLHCDCGGARRFRRRLTLTDQLARLRKKTSEARRQLAARIDRDRQFKELLERTPGRSFDFASLLDSSLDDYISGKFFLTHIGLWLEVTPALAATVFILRREWIEQYEIETVPEFLLLDMALLGYFHAVRLNKQLGDMESLIDSDLFVFDPPTPALKRNSHGLIVDGLAVEDRMRALQTQTLPVLERLNVMFVRNLRMLRELKQPSSRALTAAGPDAPQDKHRNNGSGHPVRRDMATA